MSACTECHGTNGRTYDDHKTEDCPRFKEKDSTSQQRDKQGQYSFDGNWKRLCVCGHTLAVHTAESPRACGKYGTGLNNCECRKFRPAPSQKPDDNQQLQCRNCGKRTIKIEAETGQYRTGFCGYCGGGLEPVDEQPDKERATHLRHCYQGENWGFCKYGDSKCPAKPIEQPDELDEILSGIRGVLVGNIPKAFNVETHGRDKAKQRLLSWRDTAVREARQDALTDAKDAIGGAGVPDPHGRKCWYAVDKLIPKHYRGATLQDNQPKEEA